MQNGIILPGSNGIPWWVSYQEIGDEITIELPMNWYEDNHFLGIAFFCQYRKGDGLVLYTMFDMLGDTIIVEHFNIGSSCRWCKIIGSQSDQVRLTFLPKPATVDEYDHPNHCRHFKASFVVTQYDYRERIMDNIKRCGLHLIYDQDLQQNQVSESLDSLGIQDGEPNHMPVLLDPSNNLCDNGSAEEDTW